MSSVLPEIALFLMVWCSIQAINNTKNAIIRMYQTYFAAKVVTLAEVKFGLLIKGAYFT